MSRAAKKLAPGEFIGTPELLVATRSGVIALIGQQARIDPHEHSDTHLVLVTEGTYRTSAAGAEGAVGRGGVLINPPGTRHDDQFMGPGRLVTFSLSERLMADFDGLGRSLGRARMVNGAAPAAMMLRIADEARRFDEISELEIEGLACELAASLVGFAGHDRREPGWLGRVQAMIEEGKGRPPTVTELAREAGVHPVYLTRAFRRFRGQTPGAMLRRARARRAAAMLARSREAIASIALECGFADQASFTRAFARATSMSPQAFRRRWRH